MLCDQDDDVNRKARTFQNICVCLIQRKVDGSR